MEQTPMGIDWLEKEPDFLFKETLSKASTRIKAASKFGNQLNTWRLIPLIVKAGDDMRLEQFAMQLIDTINQIFKSGKLKMKMRPYGILATSSYGGLIEYCDDSLPISHIHKEMAK